MTRKRSDLEKHNNKLRMRKYYSLEENKRRKREYASKRKNRRKYWINKHKENKGCYLCDFKGPACCYDFHHINPKSFELNSENYLRSLKAIFKEIRKCIIVCANCHRKIHGGYCDI
jgi:hypothetical protein